MMIFYNKQTGDIAGTIFGRVHQEAEMRMWVGDENENGRIIVQWKPTGKETETVKETEEFVSEGVDEYGDEIYRKKIVRKKYIVQEYEPDHPQKELFMELENNPKLVNSYRVNLDTLELIVKE